MEKALQKKYSFPSNEHLRKSKEFEEIFQKGTKIAEKNIVCIFHRGYKTRKLGIIAAGKLGKAVARNRAKRLIRESYRFHKNSIPGDTRIIIIARKEILGKNFREVSEDVKKIVLKIKEEKKGH